MMQNLLYIIWNVNPEMFTIPGIDWPVRWYGLLFACAFLCSQYIVGYIFKTEQRPPQYLDIITIYIIAGTVIGARLGHCLFYSPDYYLFHPLDIFKIWEGGLASHGAAIGIITAMLLYCRKTGEGVWWLFDRIVIVVPLSGMFIRLGNLMNSEIVGKPTTLPWGFKFPRCEEDAAMAQFHNIDMIPARHPSQLYEAIYCVFLTLLMFYLWKYKRNVLPQGFMFGLFCVLLFTSRFLMEFLKETQVDWEKGLAFDMGQWLSIPFVLGGIFIMVYSYKRQKRSLE
ncbi:MAG TPA: prolipoprotein diacylglyceryl transferase [Bacteroidia bacterium]|nr:prolipoprotein diacylglyceryl transferase [Bacteroidia bacterium]